MLRAVRQNPHEFSAERFKFSDLNDLLVSSIAIMLSMTAFRECAVSLAGKPSGRYFIHVNQEPFFSVYSAAASKNILILEINSIINNYIRNT